MIVKRTSHERRRLTPELEAFARSDEKRLRITRAPVDRGKINDPREGYAIPGVANRDARAVYASRANELVKLWNGGDLDAPARAVVGERLLDAKRLTLWRAMRITGFAALVEHVLGMKLPLAEELVREAADRLGEPVTPLHDRNVALWLRTEAGLYEGDPSARVFLREGSGQGMLSLSIPIKLASLGLTGAGARHAPLARAQREEEGRPLERPESEPPTPAGTRLLRRHAPAAESAPFKSVERPAFDPRADARNVADRPEFKSKPSFGAGAAKGKAFVKSKAFGERKVFGERKASGERKVFGERKVSGGGGPRAFKKPFAKKRRKDEG